MGQITEEKNSDSDHAKERANPFGQPLLAMPEFWEDEERKHELAEAHESGARELVEDGSDTKETSETVSMGVRNEAGEQELEMEEEVCCFRKIGERVKRFVAMGKRVLADRGNRLRKLKPSGLRAQPPTSPCPLSGQLIAAQVSRGEGSEGVGSRIQADGISSSNCNANDDPAQSHSADLEPFFPRGVSQRAQVPLYIMDTTSYRYREFRRDTWYLNPYGWPTEAAEYRAFVQWSIEYPEIRRSDESLHLSFYEAQGAPYAGYIRPASSP
ncbi:hypothetical protein ABW20_dc0107394 [Dactylellina cionopaga]|nr:hypothetical protein ABW20_dc0107394 [Dactylellina cionopaga]